MYSEATLTIQIIKKIEQSDVILKRKIVKKQKNDIVAIMNVDSNIPKN